MSMVSTEYSTSCGMLLHYFKIILMFLVKMIIQLYVLLYVREKL